MDFENRFDGIFPDDQCFIPEIIEVPDTNDDEPQPLFLPNSIEPVATSQGPPTDQRDQAQRAELCFLPLLEWNQEKSYEDPPRYIRYTLLWNVKVNGKRIARDTILDLVVAPSAYWPAFIKPEIQEFLQGQSQNKQMIPKDTNVVVSVTKHGQQSFQKRFKATDIEWSVVEGKIHKWEEWLLAGKIVKVDISLKFESRLDPGTSSKKGKRGSATQRQLTVDAIRLDAEGQNGQNPNWKQVYEFMRCTEKSCNLGNYCWNDSSKNKHFPIGTFELDDLIEYVEENGMLKSHDDVPESFRRQIYAAEEQKPTRKQARPGTIQETSMQSPPTASGLIADASITTVASARDIPGMKDEAVKDYVHYLQGQYRSEQYKAQFAKAGDLVLEKLFDRALVYKEQRPDFFTQHQVEEGPAKLSSTTYQTLPSVRSSTAGRLTSSMLAAVNGEWENECHSPARFLSTNRFGLGYSNDHAAELSSNSSMTHLECLK